MENEPQMQNEVRELVIETVRKSLALKQQRVEDRVRNLGETHEQALKVVDRYQIHITPEDIALSNMLGRFPKQMKEIMDQEFARTKIPEWRGDKKKSE